MQQSWNEAIRQLTDALAQVLALGMVGMLGRMVTGSLSVYLQEIPPEEKAIVPVARAYEPPGPCGWGLAGAEWHYGFLVELGALLSDGNSKLGTMWNFSVPSLRPFRPVDIEKTCPGATPWCERWCYAKRDLFETKPVLECHQRWLEESLKPDFVQRMVDFIRERRRKTPIRIHVAGDFYNPEYAGKWLEICKTLPDWKFYAYTRSWRIPEIRERLEELRRLPNFVLYASTDEDTGEPPPGWLEAGICTTYSMGARVCPHDAQLLRGIPKEKAIKCDTCLYCPEGKGHLWFPEIRS